MEHAKGGAVQLFLLSLDVFAPRRQPLRRWTAEARTALRSRGSHDHRRPGEAVLSDLVATWHQYGRNGSVAAFEAAELRTAGHDSWWQRTRRPADCRVDRSVG